MDASRKYKVPSSENCSFAIVLFAVGVRRMFIAAVCIRFAIVYINKTSVRNRGVLLCHRDVRGRAKTGILRKKRAGATNPPLSRRKASARFPFRYFPYSPFRRAQNPLPDRQRGKQGAYLRIKLPSANVSYSNYTIIRQKTQQIEKLFSASAELSLSRLFVAENRAVRGYYVRTANVLTIIKRIKVGEREKVGENLRGKK